MTILVGLAMALFSAGLVARARRSTVTITPEANFAAPQAVAPVRTRVPSVTIRDIPTTDFASLPATFPANNPSAIGGAVTKRRFTPGALSISQAGIDLVKKWEGLRLSSYRDSVGVWTIGYGHTGTAKAGQTITRAEADQLLRADLGEASRGVVDLVKVDLSQGEFDALTSFVFNLGRGNFASSTLLKKINAQDYQGAALEFDRWIYAGGAVLIGLANRRNDEEQLFLT